MRFETIAEVGCDVSRSHVFEHGWQSWSPAGAYPLTATSPKPLDDVRRIMSFRPETAPPTDAFQSEGLLALLPDEGPGRLWSAPDPTSAVPSIRARTHGDRVLVSADGPVVETVFEGALDEALGAWAQDAAARFGARVAPLPPAWCSWYFYWGGVTEADVLENLAAMDRLVLPIETVQIDDGYQADIGDWLDRSAGFGPLSELADRIAATGRRAGIWTAPLLVGAGSELARDHPDWLVPEVSAGRNWNQDLRVLDVTHPAAAEHLTGVFATLAAAGFGYFKLDFLYAGAMPGRRHGDADPVAAYRHAIELIRAGAGDDAVLLGCGAPLLPSIGLFDAMRISTDTDPATMTHTDDITQPGMRGAVALGRARAWMHGRLWVNDPDCLIVRPEVRGREEWAAHIESYGGLAASSDRLDALDERGLELTRRLLVPSSPEAPRWDPFAGPDQGTLTRATAA